jgi:hypothetical protein
MKNAYWIIGFVLLASACSRNGGNMPVTGGNNEEGMSQEDQKLADSKLEPSQYVSWIEDKNNGLQKEKKIDEVLFTVQYRPLPYIICEEEKKMDLVDSLVKRRSAELDGMQYVSMKIEVPNGELLKYGTTTTEQYEDRVNYFSFGMQKDIQLVEDGDTLPCLLFHYERVYDLAPYGTFLIAFSKGKDVNGDKTLIFSDNQFNKGIIKFYFNGKDMRKVPQLATI